MGADQVHQDSGLLEWPGPILGSEHPRPGLCHQDLGSGDLGSCANMPISMRASQETEAALSDGSWCPSGVLGYWSLAGWLAG